MTPVSVLMYMIHNLFIIHSSIDICLFSYHMVENGDERLQVTVGGGKTANSNLLNPALQKNAAYWVVVVTEKRSGELWVSLFFA